MQKISRYLPIALILAFSLISFNAYLDSKGEKKNEIYLKIKEYSPYYFEKSLGGLVIKSKVNKDFKEKPSNMQVFHEMDRLQKEWGKKHLKIDGENLIIHENEKVIKTIKINNKKELDFLHRFYGIK